MKKAIGNVFMGIVFFILYLPLLVMVFFSFNSGSSTSTFKGFSLKWYGELFSSDAMTPLKNTLILAVLSAVIATIIGTAAAVYIYHIRNKLWKNSLQVVTNIPMTNPDIVTGVSLMLLFVFVGRLMGAVNSLNFFTLLIAHITFNLPYVILNVLPKLNQTDPHLAEAAQDLGSPPIQAFFRVVLPSIMPGVMSGFMMAFTLSLDDFVISYYTTGADFQTLPLFVFNMVKKPVKPYIYALYSIIFILVLAVLLFINISGAKEKKPAGSRKKQKSTT
jgi:spermidine/putrescine transport system permease protein